MTKFFRFVVLVWTLLVFAPGRGAAQTGATEAGDMTARWTGDPLTVKPSDRVAGDIDDRFTVAVTGNIHPLVRPELDRGAVDPDQPMRRMVLSLKRDARQQAALDELCEELQDPQSPHYHQWLDATEFGSHFGLSERDLDRVTDWLKRKGFTIDEIPAGHWTITFSGTADQMQRAFQTAIRRVMIDGSIYYANTIDPRVPRELEKIVDGIVGLHNIPARRAPSHPTPALSIGNGTYIMDPSDFATIYNLTPLFSRGINGRGVNIAVIEQCFPDTSLVQKYWTMEGISASMGWTTYGGSAPSCSTSAESEPYLDMEWAGAAAPSSMVWIVGSGDSDALFGGVQGVVNGTCGSLAACAPVIAMSFGTCASQSYAQTWVNLWQQAATAGIMGFVSSGDSGAAGCDAHDASTATHGLAINGFCNSPYVVCVGGTEFNDKSNPGAYWSSLSGKPVGYIPEVAWNESGLVTAGKQLWASGGGYSTFVLKPSWQTGNTSQYRGVPDVSLTAALHDGYRVCDSTAANCTTPNLYEWAGGTSASAPAFAGIMALVVQSAGRQTSVAKNLYTLSGRSDISVFHDVTSGTNSVPGLIGYNAGVGWDPVTGLGSVDANALVTNWPGPTFTISGQVTISGSGLSGVTIAVTGSQTTSTTTNSSGTYTLSLNQGGNYTLTPSLPGYTFTPATQTFNNLTSNQTANFTVGLATVTISGQVAVSGAGLSGVTINVTGSQTASAVTNSSGSYSLAVQHGGSYTLTPSLAGYTFSPPSQTFSSVTTNQTANFSAAPVTVTISGQVTLAGTPLTGVAITLTGSQTNSAITGSSGVYSFAVQPGGSYTVTPNLAGYAFSPVNQIFTNVATNLTANFTAVAANISVSGQVTVSGSGWNGVRVSVTGSQTTSATTNASGSYSLTLGQGGTYTLTASLAGYAFSPPVTLANLSASQTANFTGVSITGLQFYPVTPCRLVDTRVGTFQSGFGPPSLAAGQTRTFVIPSSTSCGIPSTAAAYSLNVTVVTQGYLGYLSIWPAGLPAPNVSTLNSYATASTAVANAAIVPAGANGAINAYATDATDLILDINGYFAPPVGNGLDFYAVTPCRLVDTRVPGFQSGFGPPSMQAGGTRTFAIPNNSACAIPPNAAAYSLNITAIPQKTLGFLSMWPTGKALPNVSTLNVYTPGMVLANAAIVPAGTNGAINAYATDATDLVIDINGYFALHVPGGSEFYPMTPCRVADTRVSSFPANLGPPAMSPQSQRTFSVATSTCGVPTGTTAYSFNFTAVPHAPQLGIFTAWPAGLAEPNVSTMNSYSGSVVANAAIVPAGAGGSINIYLTDLADVLFDINGYFAP